MTIEISPVVTRRLLLSKEFYFHALKRSKNNDDMDKMIAIHNFHISIEIALKAILIQYDIRTEKTLNIDFESMLNEIDSHFKASRKKLKYRQEMRNLNNLRNLVQHHATEPASSSMEECRVFAKKTLVSIFSDYFDINFDDISRCAFISDPLLKLLLEGASNYIDSNDFEKSVQNISVAFEFASASIANLLPHERAPSYFSMPSIGTSFLDSNRDFQNFNRELRRAIETIYENIRDSEHFAAIIGSGISLSDLKHFNAIKPPLSISHGGHPFFGNRYDGKSTTKENAIWAINFVINSILSWQYQGLNPNSPKRWRDAGHKFAISERPGNKPQA